MCMWMPIRRIARTWVGRRTILFYKLSRLMLRVKYNPAYPYHIVMLKHGPFMATEKSVRT